MGLGDRRSLFHVQSLRRRYHLQLWRVPERYRGRVLRLESESRARRLVAVWILSDGWLVAAVSAHETHLTNGFGKLPPTRQITRYEDSINFISRKRATRHAKMRISRIRWTVFNIFEHLLPVL